jgi:hypothetical protein
VVFLLTPCQHLLPGEFHAAFNRHCQKFYSSEFICHNCCEECEDSEQDMVVSYEGCDDEDCEEEDPEERDDALSELMELVKSLSAEIEKMKADRDCCLSEDDVEDFVAIEALHPTALDAPAAFPKL